MQFKFACPHCDQRISADVKDAGVHGTCPTCSATFQVPNPPSPTVPVKPLPHPAASLPKATQRIGKPSSLPPAELPQDRGKQALPQPKIADTKPCPMCGEQILVVAKKCKHCGEYLDESLKPRPPEVPSTLTALELQSQMKSVGVAVVLALFLPFIGAAYASLGITFSCAVLGIASGVALAVGLGQNGGMEWTSVYLGVTVFYIISIFLAASSASSYNEQVLAKAKKAQSGLGK